MFEFIKDMLVYIIIIALIILAKIYVVSIAEVIGPSMEPSLSNDNILIVEKLTPKLLELKRFDIVVIKYEESPFLIKRIIGLPGETIKYADNQLYIDGNKVEEPFKVKGQTSNFMLSDDKIPTNKYFVLGDNREDSMDSRNIGYIDKDQIVGKALIRIWPFNRINIVK